MDYNSLVRLLSASGSADPSGEASELIGHFTGKPREWTLLNRTAPLPDAVENAAAKRQEGVPLQYITGEAWFYGDRYVVTPDVLIPQPDTECLVEAALPLLDKKSLLLDICTGSGCIAVSLLKHTASAGIALDISGPALKIAKFNAELYGLGNRLEFIQADALTSPKLPDLISAADVIVSNPPYINTDVIGALPQEVQREPRLALDGGSDGMDFYRRFTGCARSMKQDAVMLLEIGYDQSERIVSMCAGIGLNCELKRDYGGNFRVAIIRSSKSGVIE